MRLQFYVDIDIRIKITEQEDAFMKKIILTCILFGMVSSVTIAQDDIYFVPKKGMKETRQDIQFVTSGGNLRNVDEYNRRGDFKSTYYNLNNDSLLVDVFSLDTGEYADSLKTEYDVGTYDLEEEYACSRRMNRFDDFYWYDPWSVYWHRPYYIYGSPYWHAYYGWYDPWFDPWYYGWYRPWGYGWYYPAYRPVSYYYGGITGTSNHGFVDYGHGGNVNRGFSGYRGTGNRTNSDNNFKGKRYNTDRNDNFNANHNSNYNRPEIQTRPSFNNGGNFGGNRGGGFSGGGSFGGSRGSGGGSFGGRR